MADFNIRTDSVDVEQIMQRIRQRIREKRGVDFTDEDIQQLASVKLEQFLDPGAVRSDLIEQYQRRRPPVVFEPIAVPKVETYTFEDDTIYRSSRGLAGSLLAFIRRLTNPVLKLFFNPGPIIQALHHQSRVNHELQEAVEAAVHGLAGARQLQARQDQDALNFEIFNNLVVELTRLGIEVKNLRMQVESLSSRIDFDERRAQALEGVVQSRAGAPSLTAGAKTSPAETEANRESPSTRPKRRRRRGRRRSGSPATAEAPGSPTPTGGSPETPAAPGGSPTPTGGSPETPAARGRLTDSDRREPRDTGGTGRLTDSDRREPRDTGGTGRLTDSDRREPRDTGGTGRLTDSDRREPRDTGGRGRLTDSDRREPRDTGGRGLGDAQHRTLRRAALSPRTPERAEADPVSPSGVPATGH